jgi:hypothetical protein
MLVRLVSLEFERARRLLRLPAVNRAHKTRDVSPQIDGAKVILADRSSDAAGRIWVCGSNRSNAELDCGLGDQVDTAMRHERRAGPAYDVGEITPPDRRECAGKDRDSSRVLP